LDSIPVLDPNDFEQQLRRYRYERMEEARAVRVGEKQTSESAEVVARYTGLFTPEQLDSLRDAESQVAGAVERERLYRLRKACEAGLIERELAAFADEIENRILAARVPFAGEALPLRAAEARLAVMPSYDEREELGSRTAEVSASFNDDRLELVRRLEELDARISGIPDPVERNEEEKGIGLARLSQTLSEASDRLTSRFDELRGRWFDRLLGSGRDDVPASYHIAYVRRLSPLEQTYTKERCVEVCLDSLRRLGLDLDGQPNIRLDLDDRPQKSPRACVVPSDPPAVVHLITRAQGGLNDYRAFLHEAGHALHYAGSAEALPYTFRAVARDHALTEIYSYIVEAISSESGWHERYFGLSEEQAAENAEAAGFVELLLFRRYEAKLRFELEFWSGFGSGSNGMPARYSELLTEASGVRYLPDNYLADMDAGFYSADYLRAWIRSSQLREYLRNEFGDGWWSDPRTGDLLRGLWMEGTQPLSEEIAARIGFDPLDTGPLVRERSGVS
jgi:hypothetical protein